MSDPFPQHDPYGERRRYLSEANGSWAIGALLALFLMFGLIFAFASRTGTEQQATNTERGAPTTMMEKARRTPETTGSGAATTGAGTTR